MSRFLGRWESRILRHLYLNPYFPFQMRLWEGYWNLRGRRRFVLSYLQRHWIGVDPTDLVQQAIFARGAYEPEVWEALRPFLTGEDIVWDIGAHVGTFGLRAAAEPGVKAVHCFEPLARTHQALAANCRLNPSLNVIAHPIALSQQVQQQTLHIGESGNLGRTRFEGVGIQANGSEVVECLTADHLVFAQGLAAPTLIKMDVEGHELKVLKGATRLLQERPPRAIVFENPSTILSEPNTEIVDLLRSYGYQIRLIPRPHGAQDEFENFLAILPHAQPNKKAS